MDLVHKVCSGPAKADYGPARKPNYRFIMLRKYRLGTTNSLANCTRVRILYPNLHHLLLHLIAQPQRSFSSQKRSWCTVTQQWIIFLQNLTHLDVSENNIESLDLSALEKLENLQCSKNQLLELTLNGTVLLSVIAGNNRKLNNPLTCNDEKTVVILESHSIRTRLRWISCNYSFQV